MRGLSVAFVAAFFTILFTHQAVAIALLIPAVQSAREAARTSCYAGPNIGYSWGRAKTEIWDPQSYWRIADTNSLDGVIGGGQFGCDLRFNGLVLGLVADFDGSSQDGSSQRTTAFSDPVAPVGGAPTKVVGENISLSYTKIEWSSTVRGRIGYAYDNLVLLYVTGGVGMGQVDSSVTNTTSSHTVTSPTGAAPNVGPTMSHTDTYGRVKVHFVWTLGGGIEVPLADNWNMGVEYRHTDYGKLNLTASSTDVTDDGIRVLFNYNYFSGGL